MLGATSDSGSSYSRVYDRLLALCKLTAYSCEYSFIDECAMRSCVLVVPVKLLLHAFNIMSFHRNTSTSMSLFESTSIEP